VPEASDSPQKRALRTVFLDRDGVLNRKPPEGEYVRSWSDFHLLPGVAEAVARLNAAGMRVIVVSNQRGIALGLYTAEDVQSIHDALNRELGDHAARIDAFFICPHDSGACNCRKPLPGLFEQARARWPETAAETSVMIGDSLSDIEFGRRLSMRTVFIEGERGRQKPGAERAAAMADLRFGSLPAAVDGLLGSEKREDLLAD
jgi:D-glycero-D-manno-heptose 1,7-bisphosphate phosphatase